MIPVLTSPELISGTRRRLVSLNRRTLTLTRNAPSHLSLRSSVLHSVNHIHQTPTQPTPTPTTTTTQQRPAQTSLAGRSPPTRRHTTLALHSLDNAQLRLTRTLHQAPPLNNNGARPRTSPSPSPGHSRPARQASGLGIGTGIGIGFSIGIGISPGLGVRLVAAQPAPAPRRPARHHRLAPDACHARRLCRVPARWICCAE